MTAEPLKILQPDDLVEVPPGRRLFLDITPGQRLAMTTKDGVLLNIEVSMRFNEVGGERREFWRGETPSGQVVYFELRHVQDIAPTRSTSGLFKALRDLFRGPSER
jgi:hypothetical protein